MTTHKTKMRKNYQALSYMKRGKQIRRTSDIKSSYFELPKSSLPFLKHACNLRVFASQALSL